MKSSGKRSRLRLNSLVEIDPATVIKIAETLAKSAEGVKTLAEPRKFAADDARYYAQHIGAAEQAIRILNQEYIDILLQAKRCRNAQGKYALDFRIDRYLTSEIVRPILK